MEDDKFELLYTKDEITQKTAKLADQISKDYRGKEVVLICILKGAFIFMADLVRNLTIPVKIDFLRVSSYGSQSHSTGKFTVTKDIEFSIEGKDIIIVEDILDSGLTLSYLIDKLNAKKPRSIKLCVLIDKTERRAAKIVPEYVGFRLKKGFIVGYGLDFDEQYRHFPDIYRIEMQIKS